MSFQNIAQARVRVIGFRIPKKGDMYLGSENGSGGIVFTASYSDSAYDSNRPSDRRYIVEEINEPTAYFTEAVACPCNGAGVVNLHADNVTIQQETRSVDVPAPLSEEQEKAIDGALEYLEDCGGRPKINSIHRPACAKCRADARDLVTELKEAFNR